MTTVTLEISSGFIGVMMDPDVYQKIKDMTFDLRGSTREVVACISPKNSKIKHYQLLCRYILGIPIKNKTVIVRYADGDKYNLQTSNLVAINWRTNADVTNLFIPIISKEKDQPASLNDDSEKAHENREEESVIDETGETITDEILSDEHHHRLLKNGMLNRMKIVFVAAFSGIDALKGAVVNPKISFSLKEITLMADVASLSEAEVSTALYAAYRDYQWMTDINIHISKDKEEKIIFTLS